MAATFKVFCMHNVCALFMGQNICKWGEKNSEVKFTSTFVFYQFYVLLKLYFLFQKRLKFGLLNVRVKVRVALKILINQITVQKLNKYIVKIRCIMIKDNDAPSEYIPTHCSFDGRHQILLLLSFLIALGYK